MTARSALRGTAHRTPLQRMLALFENLGFGELLLVLVAALLIFGKRLPEVAGQAGTQIAKLKRSLENLRRETGIDREVNKLQRDLHDVKNVIPRDLSIGEMARIASAEMEKRIKANEAVESRALPQPPETTARTTLAEPPAPATVSAATARAMDLPVPPLSPGTPARASEPPPESGG